MREKTTTSSTMRVLHVQLNVQSAQVLQSTSVKHAIPDISYNFLPHSAILTAQLVTPIMVVTNVLSRLISFLMLDLTR